MVEPFLENLLHAKTSMALGNRCATRLPAARATNPFILHRSGSLVFVRRPLLPSRILAAR